MPHKSTRVRKRKAPANRPVLPVPEGDVFTLSDAAAYLRFTEAEIVQLVEHESLPGRSVGADWRFLKSAIQDWLRTPPKRGTREAVLSAAGVWKDDPYVMQELEEIYRKRKEDLVEISNDPVGREGMNDGPIRGQIEKPQLHVAHLVRSAFRIAGGGI